MRIVERETTKETYERYLKDTNAFNKDIQNIIPMEWACGYGWYGCSCTERDGKYFILHKLGESCD